MSQTWTHKYAPKRRGDILGNAESVNAIIAYLNRFRNQNLRTDTDKKAILLYGPPGIGKTSSVIAIAQALNFDLVVINASDDRNKKALERIRKVSKYQSILKNVSKSELYGQIILIDEVDGLSGSADRGALPEIVKIIQNTRVPIILTANEISRQKFGTLKKNVKLLEFSAPTKEDVLKILKKIAESENLIITDEVLRELAEINNFDIRGSINSLQTTSTGKTEITTEDLESIHKRDLQVEIREFLRTIFVDADSERASSSVRNLDDVSYRKLLLLMHDFAYKFTSNYDQLVLVTDLIAKADENLMRAERHQRWSQLSYFYNLLTKVLPKMITTSPKLPPMEDWQLNVPSYWITQSRQKKSQKIARKIADKCKISMKSAIADIFPYLSIIFKTNHELAAHLTVWFEFFDTEPGKRKIKLIWNGEIEYFIKFNPHTRNKFITKEKQLSNIKSKVRELYATLDTIKTKDFDPSKLIKRTTPTEKVPEKNFDNKYKTKKDKVPPKKTPVKRKKPKKGLDTFINKEKKQKPKKSGLDAFFKK